VPTADVDGSDGVGLDPPTPWRRRWLRRAQGTLHWTGLAALYARSAREHPAVILMYHSVCPEAQERWVAPRNRMPVARFEAQMRFLARRRRVLSLDALLEALERERPLPAGAVLLTFDDGYRDNLTVAAPILARHGLPATLYLATGYVERGQNQWADVLYAALRGRTRDGLRLSDGAELDLRDPGERSRAYRALVDRLLVADLAERDAILADAVAQLAPDDAPERMTLRWQEVQELERVHPGMNLGIHTRDHLDLTARAQDAALAEIRRSAGDFEANLGRAPADFSFPYARSSEPLVQQVRGLGLRSAVTGTGVASRSSDPRALPRLEAPAAAGLFGYWTSGAHPGLALRLFGRA